MMERLGFVSNNNYQIFNRNCNIIVERQGRTHDVSMSSNSFCCETISNRIVLFFKHIHLGLFVRRDDEIILNVRQGAVKNFNQAGA